MAAHSFSPQLLDLVGFFSASKVLLCRDQKRLCFFYIDLVFSTLFSLHHVAISLASCTTQESKKRARRSINCMFLG